MTTVRELVTKLSFDVDSKSLQNYEKSLTRVKSTIAAVATAGVAAAAGLFGLAKSVANTGDEIAKTSAAVGLSSTALQEWQYIGQRAGITTEETNKSLQMFSRTLGDAARGNERAVDTFNQLGVSIFDSNGELKSNEVLLKETAQALTKIRNPQIRASVAQELFGKSSQRLAAYLEQNGNQLDKVIQRAHDLGVIMSEETVAASVKFNDSLEDIQDLLKSLGKIIGAELIPVIQDIMAEFVDWVLLNKDLIKVQLKGFIEGVITFLKVLWSVLQGVNSVFQFFAGFVGGAENALKILFATILAFKTAQFITDVINIVNGLRQLKIAAMLAAIPFSPLTLAIAGVIAIIGLLIVYWDDIKLWIPDWVIESWDWLTNTVLSFINAIVDAYKWVKELFGFFDEDKNLDVNVNRNIKDDGQVTDYNEEQNRLKNFYAMTNSQPTQALMGAGRIGGEITPIPQAGLNNDMSTRNINVKSDIVVNVPPGTSESQAEFLKQSARESFRQEYERELQNVLYNNPIIE